MSNNRAGQSRKTVFINHIIKKKEDEPKRQMEPGSFRFPAERLFLPLGQVGSRTGYKPKRETITTQSSHKHFQSQDHAHTKKK